MYANIQQRTEHLMSTGDEAKVLRMKILMDLYTKPYHINLAPNQGLAVHNHVEVTYDDVLRH